MVGVSLKASSLRTGHAPKPTRPPCLAEGGSSTLETVPAACPVPIISAHVRALYSCLADSTQADTHGIKDTWPRLTGNCRHCSCVVSPYQPLNNCNGTDRSCLSVLFMLRMARLSPTTASCAHDRARDTHGGCTRHSSHRGVSRHCCLRAYPQKQSSHRHYTSTFTRTAA